jgi:hypothetical protein
MRFYIFDCKNLAILIEFVKRIKEKNLQNSLSKRAAELSFFGELYFRNQRFQSVGRSWSWSW